jgi:arylsulfatase A-like enzyme
MVGSIRTFMKIILNAPGLEAAGEIDGVHLLDIAPTLLDLSGQTVPATMEGRSLRSRFAADGAGPV